MIEIIENKEIPFIEINNNPFINIPKYKSELIVGNITVRLTKKFSWFNRLMLKLVFGLNIKNLEDKE